MRQEDDYEWRVYKDSEGGGGKRFEITMSQFIWRGLRKPQKRVRRACNSAKNPTWYYLNDVTDKYNFHSAASYQTEAEKWRSIFARPLDLLYAEMIWKFHLHRLCLCNVGPSHN
jgi:hypothetical protein